MIDITNRSEFTIDSYNVMLLIFVVSTIVPNGGCDVLYALT